jgi:hypothetical protein
MTTILTTMPATFAELWRILQVIIAEFFRSDDVR